MKQKKRNPSAPPPPTDHRTLLKIMRESKRPLSPDDILPMLGLHRRKKGDVDDMLKDLVAQGKLIRLGRAYAPMERVNLITGKVQMQRSGVAFLIPDDPRRKDVFLGQDTAGAWHGDKVAVAITRENLRKNHEGRVVRIIERGKRVLTVRVMRSAGPGSFLCRPTDPRLDFAVLTHDTDSALGISKGDIVLVAPEDQVDAAVWEGLVLSRLGPENEARVQESLVKTNHGVPTSFPQEALDEAARLPKIPAEADFRGRQDLRALPFVTIDGATARDFDDAIFVEQNGKGYRLWVAIADVAHYVPVGSGLDREAYERGNSYYFPSSVEPMFPHALSNGLCSLNPNVPRLSVAVRMDMDQRGLPGEVRVMNAVIKSHARLTYDRARDVCVDKVPSARLELAAEAGDGVVAMLDLAETLARQMRQRRIERGSLDFDLPEGEVRFDEAGNPVAVVQRERHFAHQLIEEFMIAANEAVSEFLAAHALPCLYRVHAEPDREKLETLYTLLSRLDGEAAPKRARAGKFSNEDFTPEAIGRLLSSVAGTEREFLVHRMVLRSMKQARYQPDNEGHFGLASESYAHFTSPIRRYADLVVHRLVKRALGDQHMPVPGFKRLAEMGQHLSGRERVSQEAERECHKRYACMVLRGQEGRVFEAIVSSLTDYGFWVELPEVLAEGFIRLSTMLDDYYGYLKEREMLLGSRTGRAIRVGQAVRAKLIGVHLDRLEIDLELAQDAAPSESGEAAPLSRKERRAVEESRKATRAREKRIASKSSGGSTSGSRSSGARRSSGKANGGKSAGQSSGRPAGRKKGEVRGTKRER
jgi:ribonuclease R